MITPKSSDIEDVKLPMIFIFTGLLLFVVAQFLLTFKISDLVNGIPGTPIILAAAHLILLGFGTMVAMGAMYQLVPVALQVKLRFRRLTYPQYIIYVAGVIGLAWSLFNFTAGPLVVFGSLTVCGVLLFIFNMAATIRGAERSPIRTAVRLALLFLLLTVSLGLALATDFFHPYLQEWHERLVHIHILFGTVGWFSLLIMGISFKLVPMFTLSHNYESWYGPASVHLIHIGIWVTTLGFFTEFIMLTWTGAAVIFAGFICYTIQMKKVLSHRLKKKYDLGVKVSLSALPFSFTLIVMLTVYDLLKGDAIPVVAIVYLAIFGWIALVIMGYLFKIIPFLWWTYKYGERAGQKGVPLLKEMMNERRGKWWFILYLLTIALIAGSIVLKFALFAMTLQILFFITCFGYTIELANVLRK